MRIDGSPTQRHHAETYGAATLQRLRPAIQRGDAGWNPRRGPIFPAGRARYVVMVTKHHDGFLMAEPHPNPYRRTGRPGAIAWAN